MDMTKNSQFCTAIKTSKMSLVAFLCISLTGCASMDDSQRTKAQGAGTGAIIGGILGYIKSGDTKGALVGAGIGAAGGFVASAALAERKKQYATVEKYYDGQISIANEFNDELARSNNELQVNIAQLDSDIENYRQRIEEGHSDLQLAQSLDQKNRDEYARAEKLLVSATEEYEIQKAAIEDAKSNNVTPADLVAWEDSVSTMQAYVEELQTSVDALSRQQSDTTTFLGSS